MDTKKYVDRFRKTIVDYGIPNDQVVIAPYSNGNSSGVTMFNGISVMDYMTCNNQSVKLMAKQVAKDLHVKYRRGIGF
ncbi:hypothetical protein phiJL1_ORF77 [Lactobacillus phage phiJL-1]|uniref:Uncharacterized protein n=1 Tax=Lactobacillus phage phiJL-1 TaxID=2892345 RepID=Q597X0_9CAUD|nr:hypothetical protein phiJL1_ORF77 [Lactobacillus phage phiJL-1]AAP74501.1 hypothetical protein [Lactobacillus phage phiJL-1]